MGFVLGVCVGWFGFRKKLKKRSLKVKGAKRGNTGGKENQNNDVRQERKGIKPGDQFYMESRVLEKKWEKGCYREGVQ